MTRDKRLWLRGIFPVALLLLAAFFLRAHSHDDIIPPHQNLASFPTQIGPWNGLTLIIPSGDLAVLGPGEFLERLYTDPGMPEVDLFLAYFPSQKSGDTIHSPKHCLPGSGWSPIASSIIHVPWGSGKVLNANYYVLQLGLNREVVIYWFQSHGRTVASEYWAKFYMVEDSLRMNRTDGALVRVITPLGYHEPLKAGEQRALGFTRRILPMLGNYIPG